MSTINLNTAECLRSISDFGSTRIQNICDGTMTVVPWGTADWAGAIFLMALGLFIIIVFGSMIKMMVFDDF